MGIPCGMGTDFHGFHLAADVLLESPQGGLRRGIGLGPPDFLPGGERRQRRNAHIHADHRLVFAMDTRGIGDLHGDTQEPPVGGTRDGPAQDLPGKPQGLVHAHPAELRNRTFRSLMAN
jgi:hypothetical protein